MSALADGYSKEDPTFDWEQMKRWMGQGGLPQAQEMLKQPDWIERYVGQLIGGALPAIQMGTQGSGKPEVFETHRFVIVKLVIPAGVREEELRLYVRADRIKLVFGNGKDDLITRLPCLVVPSTYRSLLVSGVLQVKLKKRRAGDQYIEALIRKSPER